MHTNASPNQDPLEKEIPAALAENLSETADLSGITERLAYFRTHPVNLNTANAAALKELFFLSPLQINNLFAHIRENGPLKELLELQVIPDYDRETIELLLPFVTLNPILPLSDISARRLAKEGEHELTIRYGRTIQQQKGFRDLAGSHYLGSPDKVLLKYKYMLSDLIFISILADKDAGETLFKNNRTGFDFSSGSVALYQTGKFSKIILGDYSMQFGQGLSIWTGAAYGKGPDVAGVAKKDIGLKPYTSAGESSFFRGAATTINLLREFKLSAFFSSKSLDASLTQLADGREVLSSINASGLHRTASEKSHQGSLHQTLFGSALNYSGQFVEAGLAGYHSLYNHDFVTGSQVYRKYAFEGSKLTNFSLHYNATVRNVYIFGESALSTPGSVATLNGIMAGISSSLSVVLVQRHYARNYHSFYTQALGEGSNANNEEGLYAGIHFHPGKHWDTSFYLDIFSFPEPRYRVDLPSKGNDMFWHLTYQAGRNVRTSLRITCKHGALNEDSSLPVSPLQRTSTMKYRFDLSWNAGSLWLLEDRLEMNNYTKGSSSARRGFMAYQDARYHFRNTKLGGNVRLAFFSTPTYENRIYAYENDVLHGTASGLYYGQGFRTYVNISYRPTKPLTLWLKYAVSVFPGKDTTGSGLDLIDGNRKDDIRFQLRYQF